MKNFAVIGASGYIATRHFQAIKETGNNLVAAMDISDSVGVLDSYFPECEFFTEFERFSAFIDDQKMKGDDLDYISICSPNYLHAPHIKYAIKNGIDVICEKPLVLHSNDIEILKEYENKYGAKVNSILQLRLHPSILALKEKVDLACSDQVFDVELTYMTSRGKWYLESWKGNESKSGGLVANIGVHFYDMLHFVFGELLFNEVHLKDEKTASGYLIYERARVKWFLSIDSSNLPENAIKGEKTTYRSIQINNGHSTEELEFSRGFTDLHIQSYENVLSGIGFGIDENRTAIKTVEDIRALNVVGAGDRAHPLVNRLL